jgi:hypothetical protein
LQGSRPLSGLTQQDSIQARWRANGVTRSFYEHWLRSENIPVYRGHYVEDVNSLQLGAWARLGGLGARLLPGGQ